MKIWEFDARLYRLLRRCLRGDYVSSARDPLTPEMREGMLRALRDTVVGERCGCGDTCCRSFWTFGRFTADKPLFTVRFHVDGELHVTCDARGDIYYVQWLRN